MTKQEVRLFLGSFFITLLLAGWLTLFLMVDSTSSRYEGEHTAPIFGFTRTSELEYVADLLGGKYIVTLQQINQAELWRKEHASLVTPRPIYMAEQLYAAAIKGWDTFSKWYSDYQYQQIVAKETMG